MRIIKFRAWDKIDNLMLDVVNVKNGFLEIEKNCITISQLFDEREDNPYILMQFTGLLDKNGKKIFEGDILNYNRKHFNNGLNCLVEWYNGGFYTGYVHHIPISEILEMDAEIIGNIYENPELIK